MLTKAQAAAYLHRIGYEGSLERSLQNLGALQRAHSLSVPFENLDIHLGVTMPVDVAFAFDKVVERGRGGYCYDLNPLFHALLVRLGYQTTIVSARFMLRDEGHPFDHIAIVVHLEEDWLVDVGAGRQPPLLPIGRSDEPAFSNENGNFKIGYRDGEYFVVSSRDDGTYEDFFAFSSVSRTLGDFEARAQWTQSSPESIFTKAPLCTLPFDDGRQTISGLNFIKSNGYDADVRKVTPAERDEILKNVFGIDLGDAKLPDGMDLKFIPGRKILDH